MIIKEVGDRILKNILVTFQYIQILLNHNKWIGLYLMRFLCGVIQMQSVRGSLSSRIQAMSREPPFRSITKWGTDNPSPMTAVERNATPELSLRIYFGRPSVLFDPNLIILD